MHGSAANTTDAALASFAVGVAAVLLLPTLPHAETTAAVAACALACAVWMRGRVWVLAAGFAMGFAHGVAAGERALAHRLPQCAPGGTVTFTGRIAAVADVGAAVRLEVDLEAGALAAIATSDCPLAVRRARLSWFRAPDPNVGERWRFQARLRSPRGYQNHGGFDYEAWLLARAIDATGYVRRAQRLGAAPGFHAQRETLRARVAAHAPTMADVFDALVFGNSGSIAPHRWDTLRRTGTVHLLVVSGLHVGLIAGAGFLVGRWLGSFAPLLRRRPARLAGTLGALVTATGYAALAGWSLPIQRAWLMALLMLLGLSLGRRVALRRWYLVALAVVLVAHPLAPLTSGFWLSFGAVALLLGALGPRAERVWLRGLLAAQFVLFIGMSPLLAAFNGEVPLVAPVANLVAVPLVTLVVVPVALLGVAILVVWDAGGAAVLGALDPLMAALFRFLDHAASVGAPLALASAGRLETVARTAVALAIVVLALLPQPWTRRALLIGALVLLPPGVARPGFGEFRLTVLDVGQGLSVHLRTARHDLLYDAGARYPSGFDVGAAVVAPALVAVAVRRLDALVVSHSDIDHQGGAAAVSARLQPRWIVAPGAAERCRAGRRWQWDGVRFELLHPGRSRPASRNDGSCVLVVTATGGRALLPGDIERRAEWELVADRAALTPDTADVVLAPHHGSRTSSTSALIGHFRPRWVLISSGYRNRFGHPHPEVLARYRRFGLRVASTAELGALRWSSAAPSKVGTQRRRQPPFWRVRSAAPPKGSPVTQ